MIRAKIPWYVKPKNLSYDSLIISLAGETDNHGGSYSIPPAICTVKTAYLLFRILDYPTEFE
jgi:hypothetical protein